VSAWPQRSRAAQPSQAAQRTRAAPLQALVGRASAFVLRPPDAPRSPDAFEEARGSPHVPSAGSSRDGPRLSVVPALPPAPEPLRPLVAVLGLAPRSGASTLARSLAARLAGLDPGGAALLFSADIPRAGLACASAGRLARLVAEAGCEGARAAGRLCVVPAGEPLAPWAAKRVAPVVADVRHGTPSEAAVALADHVVLVAAADVEPALAGAVASSLRAGAHSISLVVSRVLAEPPPELAYALTVPESRLAAQLSLACREPRGALAPVAAELAERSLAEVVR
jgi:hypothetical protein